MTEMLICTLPDTVAGVSNLHVSLVSIQLTGFFVSSHVMTTGEGGGVLRYCVEVESTVPIERDVHLNTSTEDGMLYQIMSLVNDLEH